MARVLADDEDLSVAPDDLALIAHLLDRGRTFIVLPFGSAQTTNLLSTRPAADVNYQGWLRTRTVEHAERCAGQAAPGRCYL